MLNSAIEVLYAVKIIKFKYMNNKLINNMINNGYTTIINCIDKKIIKEAQENINNTLKKLLVSKKLPVSKKLSTNLSNCVKIRPLYEIQILATINLHQNCLIMFLKLFPAYSYFYSNLTRGSKKPYEISTIKLINI